MQLAALPLLASVRSINQNATLAAFATTCFSIMDREQPKPPSNMLQKKVRLHYLFLKLSGEHKLLNDSRASSAFFSNWRTVAITSGCGDVQMETVICTKRAPESFGEMDVLIDVDCQSPLILHTPALACAGG